MSLVMRSRQAISAVGVGRQVPAECEPAAPPTSVSIIIPMFNEALRIASTIRVLSDWRPSFGASEIVFLWMTEAPTRPSTCAGCATAVPTRRRSVSAFAAFGLKLRKRAPRLASVLPRPTVRSSASWTPTSRHHPRSLSERSGSSWPATSMS